MTTTEAGLPCAGSRRRSPLPGALGAAVLPSELGATQIAYIVAGFRRWIDGYRENAEVNHAYGNSRLRFTGPTPATRWAKQLDDLDIAARAAYV